VFCALFAADALASMDLTHHDFRLWTLEKDRSLCSYCHLPQRTFASQMARPLDGAYLEKAGGVGGFCYACHDGTVVPGALVAGPDGSTGSRLLMESHGRRVDRLSLATQGLEDKTNVELSGLVEVEPETQEVPPTIECTTCHDVHDAQYPPFLHRPMEDLCVSCHSGSDLRGKGRSGAAAAAGEENGPHPVGMAVAFSGKEKKKPLQTEEERVFHGPVPSLDVIVRQAMDLASITVHWDMGGHLSGPLPEGGGRRVGCNTCHSAHSLPRNLLVLPAFDTAAATDPLCNGCHGTESAPQNPGGTPFYHPAEKESSIPYATSGTPSRALNILVPAVWPEGNAGEVLCNTCHRAHQGREGTQGLRQAGINDPPHVCDVCHQPNDDTLPANSHHLTTREDLSPFLLGRILSWNTGDRMPGDLKDGLTCIDCHAKLAKSAHNW
jgi:predicted CXXCH cytochrome family protein